MLKIIARNEYGEISPRANTKLGPEMSSEFASGSQGAAKVQSYIIIDDEDRGGIILKKE